MARSSSKKTDTQLVDGSRLQVNEVRIGGQLRKYAYYRLTPTGEVLQGWDNAPHHPEITSYPHTSINRMRFSLRRYAHCLMYSN